MSRWTRFVRAAAAVVGGHVASRARPAVPEPLLKSARKAAGKAATRRAA